MLNRSLCCLLFLCSLLPEPAFAQGGCLKPNTNIFALSLQFPEDWKLKGDPEIVLVNEDSIPYLNPGFTQHDKMIAAAPQLFLRNTEQSLKKKHPGQVWNYWPALSEEVYTIEIPADKEQYYLARIRVKHNRTQETFYYHLQKERSFNICSSGLDTLDDPADGERYAALLPVITINLAQPFPSPAVSADPQKFLFKFDVDTSNIGFNGKLFLSLKSIRVYDAVTLALVQVIPTPYAISFSDLQANRVVQTVQLDPNRKTIPDLKVVVEQKFDSTFNRTRERCLFYRYDPTTITYRADSLLSTKWDVSVNVLGKISAWDVIRDGNKRHLDSYQFTKESGWVFTGRQTSYDVPQGGQDVPAETCLQAKVPYDVMAKVFSRDQKFGFADYADSIPVYNPCSEKVGLIAENVAKDWEVTCPKYLAPQDTTWIIVKHHYACNADIMQVSTNFSLILHDQTRKTINYSYFNVWKGSALVDSLKQQVTAYLAYPDPEQHPKSVTLAFLEIYLDAMPAAFGKVTAEGLQKVGRWSTWDSTGTKTVDSVYGKEFHIEIMNRSHMGNDLKVFVYKNGKKTVATCIPYYSRFVTWLPVDMDSLRVESGKAAFEGAIDKTVLMNDLSLNLYLKYPDEQSIPLGYNEIPVTWNAGSYMLLWDYADPAYAAAGKNAGMQLAARVKARYPDLSFNAPQGDRNTFFCSLQFLNETPAQRKEILNFLIADPLIDAVSQTLVYGDGFSTYHFNSVTVGFDYSRNYAFAKEVAEKFGATMTTVNGAPNVYQFQFPGAIIDAAWTKKLEALKREPGVTSVYPEVYSEVTLDNNISPNEGSSFDE